jgi:hypothetical protein
MGTSTNFSTPNLGLREQESLTTVASQPGFETKGLRFSPWSDDHAEAATNLFSLIASCQLHSIDPERYLAELIRVMRLPPRDRCLELAPAYWTETRASLEPKELANETGPHTVPSPLSNATEQAAAN